jgi:hypothetical protein
MLFDVDIARALEHLLAAYSEVAGAGELDPAREDELETLRTMVAPLRLPDDLEQVWRRFQQDGPPGCLDTLSLGTVDLAIGAAPYSPLSRALLTIGSGGDARCYLELDDPDGTGGGGVWTLREFAPALVRVAPSLATLLEAVALAWEQGIARLSEHHPFPWAIWDEPAWERLKADVLPPPRTAGSRPSGWLPRWLAAEGLTARDIAPRGATATIADLLSSGEAPNGVETIRGRVVGVAGNPEWAVVTVDDATGRVTVDVPPAADRFQLVNLGRDIELDVRRTTQTIAPLPFEVSAVAVAVRDV